MLRLRVLYVAFVLRDPYTPFSKAMIAYCPLYMQRVIEEQYITLSIFIASITLLHFSSSPVNMVLNVHRNRTAYPEVGGEGDYIPIATLSPPE